MRIGLLGPADGEVALVRRAAEFLLRSPVDQVVYLGADDAAERAVAAWSAELMGFEPTTDAFLSHAFRLSQQGSAEQIQEFLKHDEQVRQLSALRCLPRAPARAVELFEDKVVLFVHDKAQLDAEDIANAFLVVYGRSKTVALNHFGPRTFFSPGPLKAGQVAVIERQRDGNLAIAQLNPESGESLGRTTLQTHHAKMVVLS
jgi:hypothetical protein